MAKTTMNNTASELLKEKSSENFNQTEEELVSTGFGNATASYEDDSDEDVSSMDDLPAPRPSRGKPVQYPTGKPGHYSKDRRYVHIPKKTDKTHTVHGAQGKGSKAKHERKSNQQ